jgi:hypothetical protein
MCGRIKIAVAASAKPSAECLFICRCTALVAPIASTWSCGTTGRNAQVIAKYTLRISVTAIQKIVVVPGSG